MEAIALELRPGDFAEDDYEEVNQAYFFEILKEKTWTALPAGWHNPLSVAASSFDPPTLNTREHQQYALDEGSSLGSAKDAIVELLSRWEDRALSADEVTICPSVSAANLALLCAMKRRGIEHIVFETPAYFATVEQAKLLGFAVDRIASTRETGFNPPLKAFTDLTGPLRRSALWITQPRFGIGTNQSIGRLEAICEALGPNHVLAIDEAGEQMHPSHLSGLGGTACPIVRIRGLIKGIGLNGLRISAILHPGTWRDDLERVLEPAGASIDRYSLKSVAGLAEDANLLPAMLRAANTQVRRSRALLETMLVGGWASPTKLENSYIGSVILDLKSLPGTYGQKREAILREARDLKMPIVMRASIGFAYDPDWEAIRINYFTPEANVAATGRSLELMYPDVRRRLDRS